MVCRQGRCDLSQSMLSPAHWEPEGCPEDLAQVQMPSLASTSAWSCWPRSWSAVKIVVMHGRCKPPPKALSVELPQSLSREALLQVSIVHFSSVTAQVASTYLVGMLAAG